MKNYRDNYRTTQMNPMMFRNYFYNKKNRNNVTSGSGVPGNSIRNSNNEMKERKRTYDSEGPPTKRSALIHLDAGFTWNLQALTKAAEAVAQGGKSPVSALNELGVRVVYNLLDHRGPAHCPNFTVAVTVADMTFEGYGSSKRDARANAARACLNALLMKVGQTPLPVKMNIDFSSDYQCITGRKSPKPKKPGKSEKSEKSEESEKSEKSENSEKSEENTDISEKPENSEKPVAKEKPKAPIVPPEPSPQEPSLFSPKPCIPSHKSPINKLYEMYPTIEFATTYGDGSTLDVDRTTLNLNHSMRFKVVCRLNGMTYEGYGSSKKQAKLAASKAALASIISSSPPEPVVDSITANSSSGIPQPLADHISKLVNEKFTELMQNDPVHLKRKVLAGIVITIDNELEGAKIIAVTTGTKCVSGDKMSVSGRAVNDCHAEVAARRCLQRYLYKQLLMYADSPRPRVPIESSDIEPIPLAHAGYRLKANRQIHLYISTAPCGDGRIFSPHEEQLEPDRHPNRFSRGQLRTKIESGEGTIPVKNASLIQTWDGVLQGERLLTMSCSDKLARWCVAGLQGALLAQLLQPVYLTSVVLGSLLQRDHMYRAICGRYEAHLQALPPPHALHAPHLVRAASTEARMPAKAPSFSACWCVTSPKPEIINAITGKLENDQPSLLCKQAMFARWLYIVRKLPVLPQLNQYDSEPLYLEDPGGLLYAEAKELATSYQMAKNCLMKAFRQAQLGTWVKKPIEQDQFYCEIVNANTSLLFAWAGQGPDTCSTTRGQELGDFCVNNTKNSDNCEEKCEKISDFNKNGTKNDENQEKYGKNAQVNTNSGEKREKHRVYKNGAVYEENHEEYRENTEGLSNNSKDRGKDGKNREEIGENTRDFVSNNKNRLKNDVENSVNYNNNISDDSVIVRLRQRNNSNFREYCVCDISKSNHRVVKNSTKMLPNVVKNSSIDSELLSNAIDEKILNINTLPIPNLRRPNCVPTESKIDNINTKNSVDQGNSLNKDNFNDNDVNYLESITDTFKDFKISNDVEVVKKSNLVRRCEILNKYKSLRRPHDFLDVKENLENSNLDQSIINTHNNLGTKNNVENSDKVIGNRSDVLKLRNRIRNIGKIDGENRSELNENCMKNKVDTDNEDIDKNENKSNESRISLLRRIAIYRGLKSNHT